MKRNVARCTALLLALVFLIGLAGCGAVGQLGQGDGASSKITGQSGNAPSGLPTNFPKEIPFYAGAKIIEADSFNNNGYTVLYLVDADYKAVLNFYVKAFDLNISEAGDADCYYEGIDFGDILINGLTIEETSDGVNVYMTLRDNRQGTSQNNTDEDEDDDSDDDDDDDTGSSVTTYKTAKEVELSKSYPSDVVPIYSKAKVISCSMVTGTQSGFVDLVLPTDSFEDAVAFYTDKLGLTPKTSSTSIQKAVQFKGDIGNFKIVVLISQLMSSGNDPLVQITVNEK